MNRSCRAPAGTPFKTALRAPFRFGRIFPLAGLILLLTVIAACAGGSGGGSESRTVSIITGDGQHIEVRRSIEPPSDQRLPLSPEEAWELLPEVYRALSLEPDIAVPAQRELGVSNRRFRGRILDRRAADFFNCGVEPGLNRPLADRASIDARIGTQVLAGPDGTASLRTRIQATAQPPGGTGGRAECRSTGLLERVISELTQELATAGGIADEGGEPTVTQ
jgi:hypothetical protein